MEFEEKKEKFEENKEKFEENKEKFEGKTQGIFTWDKLFIIIIIILKF